MRKPKPKPVPVRVGQVYRDQDPRVQDRFLKVEGVVAGVAHCVTSDNTNVKVKCARLQKGSARSGYKLTEFGSIGAAVLAMGRA